MIRPSSRIPRLDVGELWHYRELLWTLVWRDVAVRYKQTFLGVAWAILVPAFTALVYVIVFGKFANFPAGSTPYPSLVVAGVLPMQYFASALSLASLSLLSNLPLVTKVYFPRTLLPLGGVCVPLVDFVVGLPVLVVLMWKYDTWPSGWETLTAPLFILLAVVTVLGISLLLAAVNVRYRDVRYMIPVFLQVLPLLSGVMFAVDQIPDEVAVDPLVQPDDLGDRGLALGRARRQPSPTWARSPSASPSPACCSSSGSPPSARRSRTSRTRSDVDRDRGRLALEEVPPRRVPGGLRDAPRDARPRGEATHAAGAPSPGLGGLGAPRRLVRGSGGAGARHHRAQRRRQVDAPEDPHADRVPDRAAGPRSAAGSAACSRSGRASTRSSPDARTSTSTGRSSA